MERAQIYHTDPDILGGTPVFTGTRVPIDTLLVYLRKGKRKQSLPMCSTLMRPTLLWPKTRNVRPKRSRGRKRSWPIQEGAVMKRGEV